MGLCHKRRTAAESERPRLRAPSPRRSLSRRPNHGPVLIPHRVNRQARHRIDSRGTLINRRQPSDRVNLNHSLSTHHHATLVGSCEDGASTHLDETSRPTVLSRSLLINRLVTRKLDRSSHVSRRNAIAWRPAFTSGPKPYPTQPNHTQPHTGLVRGRTTHSYPPLQRNHTQTTTMPNQPHRESPNLTAQQHAYDARAPPRPRCFRGPLCRLCVLLRA